MPRSKIKLADASLGNTCAALERKLGPILYRSVTSIRGYDGHARKHPEKRLRQTKMHWLVSRAG